jgi:hypothetical protein
MMNFFGLLSLAGVGAVQDTAGGVLPAGTRLSVLAVELPSSITPTVAGLTVGAVVGVVGFIAVMLLVGRGPRRPVRRASALGADQVVFVPPYAPFGGMQRATPLPPQALRTPGQRPGAFVPSSDLSARAFAKMAQGPDAEYASEPQVRRDSPDADPSVFFEVEMLDEDDLVACPTPAPSASAVLVAPVVMLAAAPPAPASESGAVRSADRSAPHPLGIISATSSAMRAASIADLSFDDSPTEIGETYFDEPPQPRRRTDPPKIRAVRPAGPRFPEPTPLRSEVVPRLSRLERLHHP